MTQFVHLDYSIFTLYAVFMEPHPIPQNVTTFQFHLIGDMTLKQFLYLAAGSVISYVLLIFLAPHYPLAAWPLAIISALLGVAFAFLPISSRPLDSWLGAFLKAIYSPTKRVWKKNGRNFKEDPLFNSRLVMYLSGLQPKVAVQPKVEMQPEAVKPVLPPAPADLPSSEELQKTVDLARKAQNLQFKIIQSERTLDQIRSETQKPAPISIDYTQQVNKILSDLQNLTSQASQIKEQLDKITKPEQVQAVPVKVVIPVKPRPAQVALTTFPNVINGIIKDKGGNYLEAVITVIYDKEGLPVRALKTNKLGQFTGSTPLPNGTYTLELEKDNFSFDVLQVELTGEVLPPLMITVK